MIRFNSSLNWPCDLRVELKDLMQSESGGALEQTFMFIKCRISSSIGDIRTWVNNDKDASYLWKTKHCQPLVQVVWYIGIIYWNKIRNHWSFICLNIKNCDAKTNNRISLKYCQFPIFNGWFYLPHNHSFFKNILRYFSSGLI